MRDKNGEWPYGALPVDLKKNEKETKRGTGYKPGYVTPDSSPALWQDPSAGAARHLSAGDVSTAM